jgi:hypothetical protein
MNSVSALSVRPDLEIVSQVVHLDCSGLFLAKQPEYSSGEGLHPSL